MTLVGMCCLPWSLRAHHTNFVCVLYVCAVDPMDIFHFLGLAHESLIIQPRQSEISYLHLKGHLVEYFLIVSQIFFLPSMSRTFIISFSKQRWTFSSLKLVHLLQSLSLKSLHLPIVAIFLSITKPWISLTFVKS